MSASGLSARGGRYTTPHQDMFKLALSLSLAMAMASDDPLCIVSSNFPLPFPQHFWYTLNSLTFYAVSGSRRLHSP